MAVAGTSPQQLFGPPDQAAEPTAAPLQFVAVPVTETTGTATVPQPNASPRGLSSTATMLQALGPRTEIAKSHAPDGPPSEAAMAPQLGPPTDRAIPHPTCNHT